ncbi:MAG TPA: metallophosphoesterase [Gaiellales bacterium]|nr:metallophosphoesterase [Gaiellales bacterium]
MSTRLRSAVLAVSVLAVAMSAGSAFATTNLLPNGGFERAASGSLAGWKGVRASLSVRFDGRGGGHAVRALRTSGTGYSIVASPNPTPTAAGRVYRARGYVRSGRAGRTVCLKLLEMTAAGRVAVQRSGCIKPVDAWRAFPAVSLTATQTGDTISLRVVQTSRAVAGDSFQVDALSLTSPSDDASPPAAPTGFTAQAASQTRVALAWNASTDNRAVAGYTIYRSGVFRATVFGAATTTFLDTTAVAGRTYNYAIDAFDASGNRSARTAQKTVVMPAAGDPVIAAAGDIACDPTSGSFNGGKGTAAACQQMATSNIIENDPSIAAVLTLGDDQYGCGGLSAFEASFDPSWGRFKAKIHPAPGNHEYQTSGGSDCSPNAAGYFRYFGATAGNTQGDYAWNIGAWHMIALNGECGNVGGCDAGSPQGQFLTSHLGTSKCTLAYWHEPYYNGGGIASAKYAYFWQTLRAANADIILNGHIHSYARFAPQDANGNADPDGVREFIVGTGGEDHGSLNGSTNVQATAGGDFGILELTLHPASYTWKMVSTTGAVLDSGTTACS